MKLFTYISMVCLFLTQANPIFAQDKPVRKEIEANEVEGGFTVVPVGENGVVVYYEMEKGPNSRNDWKFTRYDTDFKEISELIFSVEGGLTVYEYKYREDENVLYILFTKKKKAEIVIYDLNKNAITGKVVTTSGVGRYVRSFDAKDNLAVYGGHTSNRKFPQIVLTILYPLWYCGSPMGLYKYKPHSSYTIVDTRTGKSKDIVESGGTYSYVVGFADNFNERPGITAIVNSRKKNESYLEFFNVDDEFSPESVAKLEVPFNNIYLNAIVSGDKKNSFYIIGNYYDKGKASEAMATGSVKGYISNGLFIALIEDGKAIYFKYHTFDKFKEFFSYMSTRGKKKMAKKKARAEKKGKVLDYGTNLLFHREVIEQNGNRVVIGEAYYPRYETHCYSSYVNGQWVQTCYTVFVGYQFTHCMIAAFDKEGEIVWDYSFPLGQILTFDLRHKVKAVANKEDIRLFYNYGGALSSFVVSEGRRVSSTAMAEVESLYDEDNTQSNSSSNVQYWYNNFFIATGFQKIKNTEKEGGKKKRYVYYFNKMAYE
ncbi:MAG: hypothetical protein KKA07_09840 [Bacteroidetes bacterium]|nr:hypothetical protein [Bacteroidota bacterium]MBU1719362.1 hypothetical protein [Bacteroidota bacterium]